MSTKRPRRTKEGERLRTIPSVESLLQAAPLAEIAKRVPRGVVVNAAREALAELRATLRRGVPGAPASVESLALTARHRAEASLIPSLRPVINATGIVLHTNLGRAPLCEGAIQAVTEAARSYTNLELNLDTGARGSRMAHLESLLKEILGAAAVLVVNNNAAAMLLALNTLAVGKDAVISRGELVEIGGEFRIPDILERAGATLREVGTTNRTRLRDFERAVGPKTGLILRVHASNFAIVGFAESVPRADLVRLAKRKKVPLLEDVGSGALIDFRPFGLPEEPMLREALAAGVSIGCASGDKLLGGPQAGILAGSKRLIDACRANPMARALRIDKLSLAALAATLRLYRDPESLPVALPILAMLGEAADSVRARARSVVQGLGAELASKTGAEVIASTAEVGGGSMPLARVPSHAVAIRAPSGKIADLARALRLGPEPVLGRIEADRLLLDLRTVAKSEVPRLIASLVRALTGERGLG